MDNTISKIKVKNITYDIEDNRIGSIASWALESNKPTYNYSEIVGTPTSLPASDVSAWAKAANKPSYMYREIGYNVETKTNASGTISIDGSKPVHVI